MDKCPRCGSTRITVSVYGWTCNGCRYWRPVPVPLDRLAPHTTPGSPSATNYHTVTPAVLAPPQPTREEIMGKLSEAMQRHYYMLQKIHEARDYALADAMTLSDQVRIRELSGRDIKQLEGELAEMETRYANLRDQLDETPEEAAVRDGIAMRLLDY